MQTYDSYFKCPVAKQMRCPVNAYEFFIHPLESGGNIDRNQYYHSFAAVLVICFGCLLFLRIQME